METTILNLAHGFSVALAPTNLWYAFLGCLVGTLVGVLPGIGPLAGISILLPVTFGLNATQAIIMGRSASRASEPKFAGGRRLAG